MFGPSVNPCVTHDTRRRHLQLPSCHPMWLAKAGLAHLPSLCHVCSVPPTVWASAILLVRARYTHAVVSVWPLDVICTQVFLGVDNNAKDTLLLEGFPRKVNENVCCIFEAHSPPFFRVHFSSFVFCFATWR